MEAPLFSARTQAIFARLYQSLPVYHRMMESMPAIVAFSGGKDSQILHAFFTYLAGQNRAIPPVLYHLNHRIRDNAVQEKEIQAYMESFQLPSSSRDPSTPSDLRKMPRYFRSVSIPRLAKRLGKTWEETGRLSRYHHLAKLSRAWGGYIVTGHHCRDYLESVLIHWIRGGGQKALETLPVWNGSIFRPLLYLSDADLTSLYEWVSDHPSFPVWEDESNEDVRYLRNRIRKDVVGFFDREHLNYHRLYWNFHTEYSVDSLACVRAQESVSLDQDRNQPRTPSYLRIHPTTLASLPSLLDWKNLLDAHLRILGRKPASRKSLEETMRLIIEKKSFLFQTKEFLLAKQTNGDLFIIPSLSSVMRTCQWNREDSGIRIIWNHKSYVFTIPPGDDPQDWSVSECIPGETILRRNRKQEISEIFRSLHIPVPIRPHIPILRKNGKPQEILFALLGDEPEWIGWN